MNKFFYVLLTFSLFFMSMNGFWSFLNDRCIFFKRGQATTSTFCYDNLLILSGVLFLVAIIISFLLLTSKKNVESIDSDQENSANKN